MMRSIHQLLQRNRLLALTALAHFALFLVLMPAAFLDSMQILGVSRWLKPMKFAISIAIFTGTMAWLLSYLQQSGRAVRVISRTIASTMIGEMVLITMQSLRGVQSHFNHNTPLDDAVFGVMGLLILVNTIAVAYATVLFFRRPTTIAGAHLTGVRLGLVIFVLASLEGGLMVAHDAHSVGVHDGGPGLPFVNWSTGAGDLRVAHFVGMHALQALPLLGWLLERRRARAAPGLIIAVAAIWMALTVILVVQALAGKAVLPLG